MKPAPSKSQATATAAAPRTVTATKSPAAASVTTATTKSAAPLVNTDNQALLGLSVSAPAPVASPAITSKNVLGKSKPKANILLYCSVSSVYLLGVLAYKHINILI